MMKPNVIITWSIILQLQWRKGMSVMAVIKAAVEMWHISVNRHVATACPSLRARSPKFESRASRAIEILEVRYVLIITRNASWEKKQYVNRRETLARAVVCSQRRKSTNVLNRTARTVDGTWRSDTSATYRHWRMKYRVVTMYYLFSMISKPRKIRKW